MSLFGFFVIAIIAGWISGKIIRLAQLGIISDFFIGVIGAFLGGFLFQAVGFAAYGLVGSLVMAVVGAIVLRGFLALLMPKLRAPKSDKKISKEYVDSSSSSKSKIKQIDLTAIINLIIAILGLIAAWLQYLKS